MGHALVQEKVKIFKLLGYKCEGFFNLFLNKRFLLKRND